MKETCNEFLKVGTLNRRNGASLWRSSIVRIPTSKNHAAVFARRGMAMPSRRKTRATRPWWSTSPPAGSSEGEHSAPPASVSPARPAQPAVCHCAQNLGCAAARALKTTTSHYHCRWEAFTSCQMAACAKAAIGRAHWLHEGVHHLIYAAHRFVTASARHAKKG